MIPEHVLQEREDRQESRARPFTQEQEKADTDFMKAMYQEDLKKNQPATQLPKQPSPEAIEIAAKMLASKAWREVQIANNTPVS